LSPCAKTANTDLVYAPIHLAMVVFFFLFVVLSVGLLLLGREHQVPWLG